jgi:5-methyltetrahydrofolate--homocysteine methyltransferase
VIVVGERINATSKTVKTAIEKKDARLLSMLIKDQEEAGADYVDLNVGTGAGAGEIEAANMRWLIDLALETTGKDLCIDSADPEVILAAVGHLRGRRGWMLNSINGKRESLDAVLPIIEKYHPPFVALAMDDDGIAKDVAGRMRVCEKIFAEVQRRDIGPGLVHFDPLVLPLVTDVTQARVTCECIRQIKDRFAEVKTIVGLSNISHGLPGRELVNRGFLISAMMSGLDAAIIDPTRPQMREALVVGSALSGRDRHCRRYTRAYRQGRLD